MPRIEKWTRSPLGAVRHSISTSEFVSEPSMDGCVDASLDLLLKIPEPILHVGELMMPEGCDSSRGVAASAAARRPTEQIEDLWLLSSMEEREVDLPRDDRVAVVDGFLHHFD